MQDSLRIETAIRELTNQGEWAASAEPPVWRLLWRLGVSLPPWSAYARQGGPTE